MSEDDVIEWFKTRSSTSILRVIEAGQEIVDERMEDGVPD